MLFWSRYMNSEYIVCIHRHDFWIQYRKTNLNMGSGHAGHDDVIKWKHFPLNWQFVRGIHRWQVISPHKGQWRGALMFSLICDGTNGRVSNGNAGDLRRHRTHYDVTVMICVLRVRYANRADSRLASCQWETSLQNIAISHHLDRNLESALSLHVHRQDARLWHEAVIWANIKRD